jgi:sugar phosphate isomerase/epimerase
MASHLLDKRKHLTMKYLLLIITIALISGCNKPGKELNNTFYAFNNCMRTLPDAPETLQEQIELIREIGYNGLAGHQAQDYFKLRDALDEAGLSMPEIYWGITIDENGDMPWNTELEEVIKHSEGRDLIVAIYLNADAYVDNKEEGDPIVSDAIGRLADFAAPYGARVAIYPHLNNYCETSGHAVKLAQMIDRKNVGAIFNTCHLLKVEGEEGWQEKLISALPFLYMISINGADSGNTKEMGWDRLIQPLGEGTFDTYELVKLAKDNGYEGVFGLQCYNINQDCEVVLIKSMDTWNKYKNMYGEGR